MPNILLSAAGVSSSSSQVAWRSIKSVFLLLLYISLPRVDAEAVELQFNCSTSYKALNESYNDLEANYTTLNTLYENCYSALNVNPCAADLVIVYNRGLHIAAIFIVLMASVLGAGIPLVAKYSPYFRVPPYVICLGKCMGIGVVLACALVHMLQPSAQSLTSPCVPWEFNTDYNAYAFLFAMLAGLVMQFLDFCLLEYVTSIQHSNRDVTELSSGEKNNKPTIIEAGGGHSHAHSILLEEGMEKRISAYMLEFGVAVHSVFIGLENGVVDEQTLKSLLVALCFHQFFEGVALGSRIADANLNSHLQELGLACVFSIAAPIGITVGVIVTSTLNPNGETFLLIQGTFDGVCGGILLYIGYVLLLKDFPEDMKRHCDNKFHRNYLRAGMFLALWTGAGVMAYIGKFL